MKLGEIGQSGAAVRELEETAILALDSVKANFAQATTQLQNYRQALTKHYGDRLRLRTYAVVAIVFERLVWREIQE